MRYCALKAARHRDGHGSRLNSRGMQGGQECWPITQELCGPLLVKESDGWDFLIDCIHRHETAMKVSATLDWAKKSVDYKCSLQQQHKSSSIRQQVVRRSVNTTDSVSVPSSEHVAEIVGRQGCKIKELRHRTNTYIRTPARNEDPVFLVTGRENDVRRARLEIEAAARHFSLLRASRKQQNIDEKQNENKNRR